MIKVIYTFAFYVVDKVTPAAIKKKIFVNPFPGKMTCSSPVLPVIFTKRTLSLISPILY